MHELIRRAFAIVVWVVLGTVAALLLMLAYVAFAPDASSAAKSMDGAFGVPIEALLAVTGTLALIVYGDIKRELWRLRKEGERRSQLMERVLGVFAVVCDKLNIPWQNHHDSDD